MPHLVENKTIQLLTRLKKPKIQEVLTEVHLRPNASWFPSSSQLSVKGYPGETVTGTVLINAAEDGISINANSDDGKTIGTYLTKVRLGELKLPIQVPPIVGTETVIITLRSNREPKRWNISVNIVTIPEVTISPSVIRLGGGLTERQCTVTCHHPSSFVSARCVDADDVEVTVLNHQRVLNQTQTILRVTFSGSLENAINSSISKRLLHVELKDSESNLLIKEIPIVLL